MADTKIQDATNVTSLDGDEAIPIADDPGGTPSDGYITPDDLGNYYLTHNNSTITTGNLSCVENNAYNCTIAGLTANRNAVLPAPSAAGKTIRLNILDGDATYALIVIGDTGVTINGGSAATEWSRLFVADETVTLQSSSTSNWQVIEDGRIPCIGVMQRQAAQSIGSASSTKLAFDTSVKDRGDIVDVTTNDRIDIRRANYYSVYGFGSVSNVLDDNEIVEVDLYVDGALTAFNKSYVSTAGSNQYGTAAVTYEADFTASQYLELYIYHTEGASQNTDTTYYPTLIVREIL